MSLFKARDWWSTRANGASTEEEEEFDLGSLCLGNVDNAPNRLDKIVVGSFHGILRVYNPHPPTKRDPEVGSPSTGFKPEDLLVEQQLNAPILQVECGRFVSGSDKTHLAVLHPRKFAVYSIQSVQAAVDYGSHASVTLQYEHILQRSACNFCTGGFGGVRGKDFVCVQSMDATLSFFEQESFAFTRFLPGSLLPGPIKFVPRTDSIVTVSSQWQLESYKYQVLAVASDAGSKEEAAAVTSGKRVTMDWSFRIGEAALQIEVIDGTTVSSSAPPGFLIFVLGERNLFCVRDNGTLKWMKKFEYNPSCFLPYRMAPLKSGSTAPEGGATSLIVCTHGTNQLLLFEDKTLEWAATLPDSPVQIRIGHFQDIKGCLVTLSENGHLQCSYLGTDPSIFMAPPSEAREINYQETDVELVQLQKRIKESQRKSQPMTRNLSDELQIIVQVPNKMDEVSMKTLSPESGEATEEDVPSVTVKVIVKSSFPVDEVKLHVHCQPPVATNQQQFSLKVRDSTEISVPFFSRGLAAASDLRATLTASYKTTTDAPRVMKTQMTLPLRLVMKPALPQKNAAVKITLDSNRPPVSLAEIFPDLAIDNGSNANLIGMQYYSGAIVSVLASKSSQRYRIQSDAFEAVWIVLDEFVNRMYKHFGSRGVGGGGPEPFKMTFDGPMPLQEFGTLVDQHHQLRTTAEKYKDLLAQRAQQFRAIQRRLLTRFKDKTPAPLNNLDVLLDGTYRQILALGDAIDDNNRALDMAGCSLSAGARLLATLVRLWVSMPDADFDILTSALTPEVVDNTELGWEETTDAALTHLLKTSLAKSAKDRTLNPPPLQIPKDTTKLMKHLTLVCDRLGKGAKLGGGGAASDSGGDAIEEDEEDEEEEEEEEEDRRTREGKAGRRKKSAGETGDGDSLTLAPLKDSLASIKSAPLAPVRGSKGMTKILPPLKRLEDEGD